MRSEMEGKSSWKKLLLCSVFAAVATITQDVVFLRPSAGDWDLSILDWWFRLRATITETRPPSDIASIVIDDQSIERLHLSRGVPPVPLALYARVLQNLKSYEPRKVVFPTLLWDDSFEVGWDDGAKSAVSELAQAMASLPTVILAHNKFVPDPVLVESATSVVQPLLRWPDFVWRRFGAISSSTLPAIHEAALEPNVPQGKRPSENDLLNFYTAPVTAIPFWQMAENSPALPLETFKGKIVFVGVHEPYATLRGDSIPAHTPLYDRVLTTSEVIMTQTANLLDGSWIRRPKPDTERIVLGLFVFLATFCFLYMKPWKCSWVFAICVLSWSALSFGAFLSGWLLLVKSPLCILLTVWFVSLMFKIARAGWLLREYKAPHALMGSGVSEDPPLDSKGEAWFYGTLAALVTTVILFVIFLGPMFTEIRPSITLG